MNSEETASTDSQPAVPLIGLDTNNKAGQNRTLGQARIRLFPGWFCGSSVDRSSDRIWVQENPDKPLTLHTSPANVAQSTIPRLISVVEILKREYLKTWDVSAGQLTGLHQYNELQWEQRGEIAAEGEERASTIARALEGKKYPKLTLAPYMKVTLCRKALPGMHEKKDVTYQTPQTRRLSKTTKARLKKKAKQQMP
ncbi:hypothetical protein DFJ58DRAFT_731399 [Suillus subalutaceus]|uniref:uncharacterized protein n=1 Tax=Suillus subalutaceus TaxID=48586 RepID=UPI001B86E742|nr:uncharacterized protein DFJ58DRAFT_731399 [Suillus subalutaceus]KAG1843922.1 hypothetical protein DFJ58DRAFT_731399 [Suillus subalutaceus]